MITEYKIIITGSREGKLILGFLYKIRFDIQAQGKNLRDRNLKKNVLSFLLKSYTWIWVKKIR